MGIIGEHMIAEGDRIVFRGTLRGTHQGTNQGIAATGKQVAIFAFDLVHIEDGRLTEHWYGPDLLTALLQLGAMVAAGPEKK